MRAVFQRLSVVTRPRALLSMALLLGLLASYLGESTSAERRESFFFAPSTFESGTVDIAGLLAGSAASTLPTAVAFKWDSSGAGADCGSLLPLPNVTTQAMLPGHYCIANITLRNTNSKSLDAWLRVRLVRQTPAGTAANEALNNRLRFFMHEYSAGSGRTAAQYQAADCTVASYKPVPSVTNSAPSTAIIPPVTSTTMGSRLPLDSVGQAGKNIGTHPGISVPTDTAVSAMSGTGFGLSAGIGGAAPPTSTAALDSWTMSTDSSNTSTYSAVNLIGNDEVTNPRHLLNSNLANGVRPAGTLPEAQLLAGGIRYYCAAIFFPSDTSNLTAANGAGDNAAIGGAMTYYLSVAAAQQFNRSVD